MSVAKGVSTGRLAGLIAIRDSLASAMDQADAPVQAQLSGQLVRVLEQIEVLESRSPEVSESHDIKRDLAAGLADSKVVQLAGRRRVKSAG